MLNLTNTLTGKKELFKPLKHGKVRLYVCGITPYDYAHLGHGRVYVLFDVLYRFLIFLGYNVTYCRNFTDIDDKLVARAEQQLSDPLKFAEIAHKFIDAYHNDMRALNTLPPDYEPRVTETIPEIIAFVDTLIKKKKAYQVDGNVYFSIDTFDDYTKLSKQKLEDLHAGARIEVETQKKNPLDFALWKGEKAETFWQSPWGWGRPGWHIECSAMARTFLGDRIDIHGGGMDLIFPHHENEIAQTESLTGQSFANYWIHNAFVAIDKEKMSKSLGNYFTLRDIFKQFDPMVVRFLYLNHHYRAPIEFSIKQLQDAEKAYQRLVTFFGNTKCSEMTNEAIADNKLIKEMLAFLCDDLNTTGMLGLVFSSLDLIKQDSQTRCAVRLLLQRVLGLTLTPLPEKKIPITPKIQQLIDERNKAREQKDWQRADELRKKLAKLGFVVQDQKLKI